MKNILLITDVDFWRKGAGHRVRISALVDHLSAHSKLNIAYLGPVPDSDLTMLAGQPYRFVALDSKQSLSPTAYGERFEELFKNEQFDAVIIEYIHLSYMLNFVQEDSYIILDAHDIISERTEEFKKFNYAGVIYEMPAALEEDILQVYDKVMVLCRPDHEKLQKLIGDNVLLCPHPSEIHRRELRDEAKNIVYIASEYLPNVDAINHFIANCWPEIAGTYNVELHIYGNVCRMLDPVQPEGVVLKGYVADLQQVYNDADIVLNPIRFGAGMKIKNLEALANGLPLVTTAHGARGLEPLAGKGLLIADTREEFVTQLGRLIESATLRRSFGTEAIRYMSEHFSAAKCFAPLLAAINQQPYHQNG